MFQLSGRAVATLRGFFFRNTHSAGAEADAGMTQAAGTEFSKAALKPASWSA